MPRQAREDFAVAETTRLILREERGFPEAVEEAFPIPAASRERSQ
jgi:hypothetical protein